VRKISGVYAIRNKLNGDTYIGCSVTVGLRWSSHKSLLRRGASHNKRLQQAWTLYGEECFEFVLISECTIERGKEVEQRWLFKQPQYNITLNANGGQPKGAIPKYIPCNVGRKHTPQEVENMKIAQKKNWSEGGKRWSQRKISESQS
jgi:group I intron endonuclease